MDDITVSDYEDQASAPNIKKYIGSNGPEGYNFVMI